MRTGGVGPPDLQLGRGPHPKEEMRRKVPPEAGDTSKNGDGGPFQTLHVREGDTEMVFLSEEYGTALFEDAQTVETISLRPFSEDSRGSC